MDGVLFKEMIRRMKKKINFHILVSSDEIGGGEVTKFMETFL